MLDPIKRHPTRSEQLDILTRIVADATSPGDRVLDVGCGTGYAGFLLARRRNDLQYVGVDLSPTSLEAAANYLDGFERAPVLIAADLNDVDSIELPCASFKAIWTVLTFHDLTDPAKQRVLAWMAGHLADDGLLLVHDRIRLTVPRLFPVQQTVWQRLEEVHGEGMRTAASYAEYLDDLDTTNRPATLADYGDWLSGLALDSQIVHLHGNTVLIAATRQPT
ncbi:MAG: class I SAM-dependent methyltransferase [Pseudomonadota bacterium]